jgi:hypothetical protein
MLHCPGDLAEISSYETTSSGSMRCREKHLDGLRCETTSSSHDLGMLGNSLERTLAIFAGQTGKGGLECFVGSQCRLACFGVCSHCGGRKKMAPVHQIGSLHPWGETLNGTTGVIQCVCFPSDCKPCHAPNRKQLHGKILKLRFDTDLVSPVEDPKGVLILTHVQLEKGKRT